MKNNAKAVSFAILAAILYGINQPLSKLLLVEMSPTLLASLLYFGAGIGMSITKCFQLKKDNEKGQFKKKETPYILGMIILDIIAPICLMIGLVSTTSANSSLISNFEIVATSIFALSLFKEKINLKLWIAIALITISCLLLSLEDKSSFTFSIGSLFIMLACISWGLENNCTKMLSHHNPVDVVILKGFGAGFGSLLVAIFTGCTFKISYIPYAILIGFVSYGLSIMFYVYAQRFLGAAKTSAFYAFAPFFGVILSFIIFKTQITTYFIVAIIIMIIGSYLAATDFK